MAIKYGKCTNPTCHQYNITQDAEELNFVCGDPRCGYPLEEVQPKRLPNYRNRTWFLIGAVSLFIVLGAVWFLFIDTSTKQQKQEITTVQINKKGSEDLGLKSMGQWISELSDSSMPIPKPSDSDEYQRIWNIVNGLKSRTNAIRTLKQVGKVIGSEYGMLNMLAGVSLSDEERNLLNQENGDRRSLFAFIAEHSAPPMSYERVANEYAKNQWKEWPPKQ